MSAFQPAMTDEIHYVSIAKFGREALETIKQVLEKNLKFPPFPKGD
jgi:hypothetical protein